MPGAWTGTRAAVTGAGGFIGSHLVERLLAEGATVRAFVRYTSRHDDGLLAYLPAACDRRRLQVLRGDIRDYHAVRDLLDGTDIAFHLAALIGIPYSYGHVDEVVAVNVGGTANVLNAARATGTRVMVVSSSEVYGSARQVPMDEAHPVRPRSPYAASKVAADALAESFHAAFGLPVTVARPFNTFGPRQSDRAVIPTVICQALAGDEIMLGNLGPRRDFTYVTDTVAGLMALAASGATIGERLNLGTGSDVSIAELVDTIGRLLERSLRVTQRGERARPPSSEIDRLVADAARANELTGWKPEVPLEEGLLRTIEWVRDHAGRYAPTEYRA